MTPPLYLLEVLLAAEARQRALAAANGAEQERMGEFLPSPFVEGVWEASPEPPLTPQQFLCLSLRYQDGVTLAEVAEILDVSVERARQVETVALRRLSIASVRVLAARLAPKTAELLLERAARASPMKWRRLGETFA